jgi:hypothetical protein
MIELLRNCPHGSEIATYLETDNLFKKTIIKVTTTPAGISDLAKEVQGWDFYQKVRYPDKSRRICEIVQQREQYLKIRIEFIDGVKANCSTGLEINADLVGKVIEHYCNIWPNSPENDCPLHGDLSLDNIIYNRDGVHIIDWEHFKPNGAPWGYDALYLLYETLFFGMRIRIEPTKKEVSILSQNIRMMNSFNQLDTEIIGQPLHFLKDFINSQRHIWGDQLRKFPDKLPVLKFTESQTSQIDSLVAWEV